MKIAIVGLGYVGLPLSLQFARSGGVTVLGLDIDPTKVESLNSGRSYIKHIMSEDVAQAVKAGAFVASADFARVKEVEAIIICVPTPLNKNREPDISFILNTGRSIAPHLKKGILVVLESTTYPGTTDEDLRAVLESGSGLKAGTDFHLAFSPEREDPGNPDSKVALIPKVIGGFTPACLERAKEVYGLAIKTLVPVSSCRAAEAAKLTENIFRGVNIALVNELKIVYTAMGIDVWEVINAAKTKPFGFMPFYPGLGVGGHCIPEDPLYLYWKAKHYDFSCKFIKLAADTNHNMPHYAVTRLKEMLGKAFKNARILVLGVTYKKDVKDLRKSPSIRLIELLRKQTRVDYYDPLIPYLKLEGLDLKAIDLTPMRLKGYDVVVVAVDHSAVDYNFIYKHARLIFDTRNVYKAIGPFVYKDKTDKKVVKL